VSNLQNVNCSHFDAKEDNKEGEKITWNEGSGLLSLVIAYGGTRWQQAVALCLFFFFPVQRHQPLVFLFFSHLLLF
jgi:hypothetical protein